MISEKFNTAVSLQEGTSQEKRMRKCTDLINNIEAVINKKDAAFQAEESFKQLNETDISFYIEFIDTAKLAWAGFLTQLRIIATSLETIITIPEENLQSSKIRASINNQLQIGRMNILSNLKIENEKLQKTLNANTLPTRVSPYLAHYQDMKVLMQSIVDYISNLKETEHIDNVKDIRKLKTEQLDGLCSLIDEKVINHKYNTGSARTEQQDLTQAEKQKFHFF